MNIRIPDFSQVRVLVAGDVMFDRYWYGATGRISPEAPVPVVKVEQEEGRPGGAGNVAANIVSLGGRATVVGAVGRDEAAARLRKALGERGVDCDFVELDGIETTTKLRVISRHQQLIRLDFESTDRDIDAALFNARAASALPGHQVLILSDYAKGTLGDPQALIRAAREAGVPVLVDPKGRDFQRYRGATLLTPNLSEFEAIVGPCRDEDTLVEKARRLREELELEALLVTRSEHGMTLVANDGVHHLPAQALEVFDVTGAGDTAIAVLAAGLAAGLPLPDAAALGNFAAGLVVARLGAASVTPTELKLAVKHRTGGATGILEEDELVEAVRDARQRGERVVMTNGCFDILHAGHVAYLQEARALGDRLVVAVNTDESVRRLKGPERPIVPLAQRMAVLEALDAVDWVVPFGTDTPRELIARVKPDILVKGGDYRPEEIAGYEEVIQAGGEVRVLHFEEGISTTGIISRIRSL
ncbi:MAG TPA: bifunctional D-glycero-beta-D-manno-heptose-7-phosphate kinase/D-glycero-beta-D-manno-heptose 1-phosphate adenylyltransferase HldE [Gammaproteobacteria bacterium]|nr:bifunctional D-glycero-beta-D-manno-heptose-7-phosphate kinase/D-glycero-beta-D-manno-heptose 1-phosphate adenylyltransferase HldE [Gammaproteobacteria bacterium]